MSLVGVRVVGVLPQERFSGLNGIARSGHRVLPVTRVEVLCRLVDVLVYFPQSGLFGHRYFVGLPCPEAKSRKDLLHPLALVNLNQLSLATHRGWKETVDMEWNREIRRSRVHLELLHRN